VADLALTKKCSDAEAKALRPARKRSWLTRSEPIGGCRSGTRRPGLTHALIGTGPAQLISRDWTADQRDLSDRALGISAHVLLRREGWIRNAKKHFIDLQGVKAQLRNKHPSDVIAKPGEKTAKTPSDRTMFSILRTTALHASEYTSTPSHGTCPCSTPSSAAGG
jgi:hypothetical protein